MNKQAFLMSTAASLTRSLIVGALLAGSLVAGSLLAAPPAAAQALKTAGSCNDEYKANKPALKAAKELKRDFITACRATPVGTSTPIGGSPPPPPSAGYVAPAAPTAPARTSTVSGLKTAGACNDEYKANKGALKDAKEKKKDFIAACRALAPGTPTPINGGGAAPAPAPAPTAPTPAPAPAPAPYRPAPAPSPAPAPRSTPAPSPRAPTTQNSAPGESACSNGYAHLPASHTAVQYCTEQEAKSRCPGAPVVWVNTKTHIYHNAGAKTYGHTKEGAYMCETDATGEGDRVSKNGH